MRIFKSGFIVFVLVISGLARAVDYIRDIKSAERVGEALLVSIYGETVLSQKPFTITETKRTWILDGTFHCPKGGVCLGGVAHIEFNKGDAKIITVSHSK